MSAGQAEDAAADFKKAADYEKDNGQMYAGIYEQLVMAGLLDDAAVEGILRKTPCLLGRETDYEQMSLF